MFKRTSSKKGFPKTLGVANRLLSVIPDIAEIVGKIVDNFAPIIDKELQRHHDKNAALVELSDVKDMLLPDAQEYLKDKGFSVHLLLAKLQISLSNARPGEVVHTSPRSGKFTVGHLVKLYYVNEGVIQDSLLLLQAKQAQNKEFNHSINQVFQGAKSFLRKEKEKS